MTFKPENVWLLAQLRPFIRTHLASFVLTVISSLLVLSEPLIIRFLIDDVLIGGSRILLLIAILGFLLTYLGRIFFNAWGVMVGNRAVQKMIFKIRLHLLRKVQQLSSEYHEKNSVGDLLFRLEQDVALVGEITGQITTLLLRTAVTTTLILVTMFVLNWRLTCIVLPLVPAFLFLRHRFQLPLRDCSDQLQKQKGRVTAFLQDQISCMTQVQLVCRELTEACKFSRLSAAATRTELRRLRMEVVFASSSSLIIVLSVMAILGVGSYEVLQGTLSVGSLVAFYSYALQLFAPLYAAMDIYSRFQRVGASARRLCEIEQAPVAVLEHPDAVDVPHSATPQLELKNVCFSYGPDKPLLTNVSLKVDCGEKIALVGSSGAGKSTIARLVARMYDAGDGAIFVNGIDVRELRLKSLRSTVSFVPQEAPIFDASLLENLRYGNPKASDGALESVIQITQLENVIARLALGWNEPVGPRGNKLSGGERQRVALARALLQRPQIIVLDESTSALDAVTEQNLFEAMSEVSQETITIVISHRLSTIMWADRIVVIDRGRVIAEGSHSSLYETNLSYRLLCESQFELEPKTQVVKKIQLQHGDAAVVARRSLVGTAG
jgi:ABC-type multidrug transport system fused ATPase/permease subunit